MVDDRLVPSLASGWSQLEDVQKLPSCFETREVLMRPMDGMGGLDTAWVVYELSYHFLVVHSPITVF